MSLPARRRNLVLVSAACAVFLFLCWLPAGANRAAPGSERFGGSSGRTYVTTTKKNTKLKKHATNLMPSVDIKAMNLIEFDQQVNLGLMVRAADGSARPTLKKTVLQYWFWCVLSNGNSLLLDSGSTNFDKYGNAAAETDVLPQLNGNYCDRFRATFDFAKRGKLPEGSELLAQLNATPVPSSGCTPGNDTLCLGDDGRFQVEVDWRGPGRHSPSPGFAQNLTGDSGMFWFFGQDNWEMVVKVLDGCATNDHFWVFAAATTDVEYQLTVTDTMNGQGRTYSNLLGAPAPAVTDTSAFATCP